MEEPGLCHNCSCKEGGYIALAILVCLILLPLLAAWTLLGLMLSRSPLVAVTVGWIVFSVFAVVSIAIDPFEWGYVFGIGLDLLVVTVIVLGYDWPHSWRFTRSAILYLLVAAAIVLAALSLSAYSQDGAVSGMLSRLALSAADAARRRLSPSTSSSSSSDSSSSTSPDTAVSSLDGFSFTVYSEATLMEAMNDCAMITGAVAVAWIVVCDQALWLPATEDKLLEAETRVLRTLCSKRVVQLVVEGLGTLIVTDEDSPHFEPTPPAPGAGVGVGTSAGADDERKHKNGKNKPILVLVHGYASANAYWAPVLGPLQEMFQVYCVELIGWGRSDRVPWTARSPDEVLSLYRDSIERWRRAMGLERFLLLGHSLGCHACAAYATHYPDRVSHLLFASPAGVGLPPESMRKKMDQTALLDYEFETPSDTGASTLSTSSFRRNFQFSQFTYSFLSFVWESNLTPMDGVRWLGPFGHVAVAGILERRALKSGPNSFLRRLRRDQSDALIDFTYQNQANPPSGERALAPIFLPGAYAKKPLFLWLRGRNYRPRGAASDVESPLRNSSHDRDRDRDRDVGDDRDDSIDSAERRRLLGSASAASPDRRGGGGSIVSGVSDPRTPLGNNTGSTADGSSVIASLSGGKPRPVVRTIDCPVTLIYGTPNMDWMNSKYGRDLCDQLQREGVDARLHQMSESGHIVYMEQPEEFVFLVRQSVFNREGYTQLYRPG